MKLMNATQELGPVDDLVARIHANLKGSGGRVVGFIASGAGEGTTTVARAYVNAVASHLRRRVIILDMVSSNASMTGVLPTLAAGQALESCLKPLEGGGFYGSLGGVTSGDTLWELLTRTDLWAELRNQYDDIVLDLPPVAVTRMGLTAATQCDGVVVVIEAEKTRAPVVEYLIASLQAVDVRTLGTVLNRRRFHLPPRIYRWL